ncbi:MAG: N-acetylmuramoyl-L-alanine amidase [Desulfobulbaceae bacterium]|nr:N-acetylmuramoyl-L-alanine amidase [Desulfobulbaceae bacterium]
MKVTKIVVHHSASDRKTTTKNDIEKWHKDRGFSQIGYHKIIEGTGMIKEGRSELIQSAHAKGANLGSFGVCVVGNFEKESCNPEQINSLVKVLTQWCKAHDGLDETKIYGHYNVPGGTTKTVCPGKHLKSGLSDIKLKVKNKLKTGLQPI